MSASRALRPKLTARPAPAYWVRWDVADPTDGAHLGSLERRGGFAPWSTYGPDGRVLGAHLRTRRDALALLWPEA